MRYRPQSDKKGSVQNYANNVKCEKTAPGNRFDLRVLSWRAEFCEPDLDSQSLALNQRSFDRMPISYRRTNSCLRGHAKERGHF